MRNEWENTGAELFRTFAFENFSDAFSFAEKIAVIAEEMNHHPELTIAWGKCAVSLTSHDAHGITERDFELAEKIDSITDSEDDQ
jgi:4a-hydroxytetrahydrobiopterin dehydratase